jgi:hypothetical protein
MKLKLIKGASLLLFGILMQFALPCISKTKAAKTSEANNAQISSDDSTAEFNFETGTQGWKSENWKDFRGSYGVEQTTEYSKSGRCALVLNCDSTENSKREAFVDLRTEFNGPLNLEGKTIRCWILIPSSDVIGDPHNGVQLFVKSIENEGTSDERWSTEYGEWYDLSGRAGSWFEITLSPGTETPKQGHSKQGFDPKKIAVLGIRITTRKGSSASFKGSVYIDDIDW